MEVEIRKATVSDTEQITELLYKYLGEYETYSTKEVGKYLSDTIVADSGGHIVGCVEVTPFANIAGINIDNVCELNGVAVDVNYRSRGIANNMIDLLSREIREKNILCAAMADTGRKARLDTALKASNFELMSIKKNLWPDLGDCGQCAEKNICNGSCEAHVYIRYKIG